ncbi:hypothetical protein [Bacillus sp. Hm123]|uniref:hypothetical protein n=1 Tax=Bacillus sp. Hm123 TaxID=3450745 RepID=UPI003F43D86A
MKSKEIEYAAYRGDTFIAVGTIDYLAKVTGLTVNTLKHRSRPSGQARVKANGIIVYKVDDEE